MAVGLHPQSVLFMGLLLTALWQFLCSLWHVKIRQHSLRERFLRFFAYFWVALAVFAMLSLLMGVFFKWFTLFFYIQEFIAGWGSLVFIPFVVWYYFLTIQDIRITLTKTV